MLVNYTLEHKTLYPQKTSFEKSCTSPNHCIFSIPQIPGLIIGNPNAVPEKKPLYNLVIVSPSGTIREEVGSKTVLLNESAPGAMLKAESVPMQIMYWDGKFVACNANDFVLGKEDIEGNALVPEDSQYGSCDIVGQSFCDHKDGENVGWSDESLSTYPGSTEITLEDGSTKDVGGVVTPNYRSYAKKTYNLIPNGGFEKVR